MRGAGGRARRAAREAGVDADRLVGDDARRGARRARARRAARRRRSRRSASTRTRRAADARTLEELCGSCSRIRRRSRSARPGSTTSATTRRATRSSRSSTRQLALARELGKPRRHPHPRRRRRHARGARGLRRHGGPALLLLAAAARAGARARLVRLVRRQRHLPERATTSARRRARVPADRLLAETDSPYLAPQPQRGRPQRAGVRRPHARRARARRAATSADELAAQIDANADALLRPVTRRARRSELGQHFLVDENILGVIGRLAELAPTTSCSRSARASASSRASSPTGSRTSTRSRSTARSSRSSGGPTHVRVHWGDALELDLAALEPAPRKLVANLPYNIATPLVVESLDGLPPIERWCVMVQREVADRFFARPGTKAYGAVSVLVQLATERTGFHPVSREVFRPRPNVDSALVAFRRAGCRPTTRASRRLVEAAFAHRRKTLANSLALVGRRDARARGRGARGHRPRAGRRGPRRSSRTSSSRSPRRSVEARHGEREDQPRARGRPDASRRQARGRHGAPAHRPRRRASRSRPPDALERRPAFADDTLVTRALDGCSPRPTAASRAGTCTSRSGSRSPPASAAAARTPRRRSRSRTRRSRAARPSAPRSRRAGRLRRAVLPRPTGPQLGTGTGTDLEPVDLPQDYWIVLVLPDGERKESTAAVYARFDGGAPASTNGAPRSSTPPARPPRRPTSRRCRRTTSRRRRCAAELRELGAFRADVSGAGPDRLRAVRPRARRARRGAPRCSRRGQTWISETSVVRLSACPSDAMCRTRQLARRAAGCAAHRLRIALWIAARRGGRSPRSRTASRGGTIVAARASSSIPLYSARGAQQQRRHDAAGELDRAPLAGARRVVAVLLAFTSSALLVARRVARGLRRRSR